MTACILCFADVSRHDSDYYFQPYQQDYGFNKTTYAPFNSGRYRSDSRQWWNGNTRLDWANQYIFENWQISDFYIKESAFTIYKRYVEFDFKHPYGTITNFGFWYDCSRNEGANGNVNTQMYVCSNGTWYMMNQVYDSVWRRYFYYTGDALTNVTGIRIYEPFIVSNTGTFYLSQLKSGIDSVVYNADPSSLFINEGVTLIENADSLNAPVIPDATLNYEDGQRFFENIINQLQGISFIGVYLSIFLTFITVLFFLKFLRRIP